MPSGNGKGPIVPWGLRDLDDLVGSGFPGRLVVIGARPSNGKSTLLLNWCNTVYAGHQPEGFRVLCYWTEHTQSMAYLTWACMRAGVPLDPVVKGQWDLLPEGAEGSIYADQRQLEYDERFVFAPTERPTVGRILMDVEEHKPTIIVFDYIQRIKSEGRQTKFEALADAAVMFREVAIKRPALVVVGSQLKRRGDGVFDKYRPPYMEDFKGAGEIEEAANIALGLFRPLRRMTAKEEKAVRTGEKDLEDWKIPHAMAIKCLKHHYWPDSADRIVRVECKNGQIRNWDDGVQAPVGAGDAWEPEGQDDLPF